MRFFLSDCPSALHENSARHHAFDLVMTNITDEYHTIPAKSAAIFAYAEHIGAAWAFKTDDDSFVNVPTLLKLMASKASPKASNYVGRFHKGSWPFRDPKNKWYVSEAQYPRKLGAYPNFAAGVGYALRKDAIKCVMNKVATSNSYAKTMWLEDVYMGLLGKDCNLKHGEIGPIYLSPTEWKNNGMGKKTFLLVHYVKEGHFMHLWNLVTDAKGAAKAALDPLAMCAHEPAAEDHCKAVSPTWTAVDNNRACEGSGLKRFAYKDMVGSFECCKKFCELHCNCLGIDYYKQTDWCNLFDAVCPKAPKRSAEGASHHRLNRGGI